MVELASVITGSAMVGWMVHPLPQPGMSKSMTSGPGLTLAAQIASRRLMTPSGPGSESRLTAPHVPAASRMSLVVSTVMLAAWAFRNVPAARAKPRMRQKVHKRFRFISSSRKMPNDPQNPAQAAYLVDQRKRR
jgi:hypothetical protein